MANLIMFRHGPRHKNTGELSGDGPLTAEGMDIVSTSTQLLVECLEKHNIRQIDLAIVSGSVRCAETFAIIWRTLIDKKITVSEYDMHKTYYGTRAEDVAWNLLYAEHKIELHALIKKVGERKAVMKYAGVLVAACVDRTIKRIKKAFHDGDDNVLVVTHGPHDAIILERLGISLNNGECLQQGMFHFVGFKKNKM